MAAPRSARNALPLRDGGSQISKRTAPLLPYSRRSGARAQQHGKPIAGTRLPPVTDNRCTDVFDNGVPAAEKIANTGTHVELAPSPSLASPLTPHGQEAIVRAVYKEHARQFFEELKQEFAKELAGLQRQARERLSNVAQVAQMQEQVADSRSIELVGERQDYDGIRNIVRNEVQDSVITVTAKHIERVSELADCMALQQEDLNAFSQQMRAEMATSRSNQATSLEQMRAMCVHEIGKAFHERQEESFIHMSRQHWDSLESMRSEMTAQIAGLYSILTDRRELSLQDGSTTAPPLLLPHGPRQTCCSMPQLGDSSPGHAGNFENSSAKDMVPIKSPSPSSESLSCAATCLAVSECNKDFASQIVSGVLRDAALVDDKVVRPSSERSCFTVASYDEVDDVANLAIEKLSLENLDAHIH